mmetsp:Transcript_22327/g.34007  ORF Transcript_22327/g.34007 Transcript_22327/m.34007 type:complete len:231 (-) Transcript_22327:800-1492(-)
MRVVNGFGTGRRLWVRVVMRRTKLCPSSRSDHFLDVLFVEFPLLSFQMTIIRALRLAHVPRQTPTFANSKDLWIRTRQGNNRFARIDTTGSPLKRTRRRKVVKVGILDESIPFGLRRTLTGVTSNRVDAFGTRRTIALRYQGGTGMLILGHVDATFVNVIDDDTTLNAHVRGRRPWHGDGVIDVEFTDLGEATWWEGLTVRDFQTAEIVFGIFVDNVDHVFSIFVTLLQS